MSQTQLVLDSPGQVPGRNWSALQSLLGAGQHFELDGGSAFLSEDARPRHSEARLPQLSPRIF